METTKWPYHQFSESVKCPPGLQLSAEVNAVKKFEKSAWQKRAILKVLRNC